jgi:hypothetical protein
MGNSRDGDEGRAGVTGVSGQSLPGLGEAGAKVMPGQTVAAGPGSLTPEERAAGLWQEHVYGDGLSEEKLGRAFAAAIRAAVAEERAACLAIASEGLDESDYSLQRSIVERIRARGES